MFLFNRITSFLVQLIEFFLSLMAYVFERHCFLIVVFIVGFEKCIASFVTRGKSE